MQYFSNLSNWLWPAKQASMPDEVEEVPLPEEPKIVFDLNDNPSLFAQIQQSNILVIGPAGCGKSSAIQSLCPNATYLEERDATSYRIARAISGPLAADGKLHQFSVDLARPSPAFVTLLMISRHKHICFAIASHGFNSLPPVCRTSIDFVVAFKFEESIARSLSDVISPKLLKSLFDALQPHECLCWSTRQTYCFYKYQVQPREEFD